MVSKKFPDLGRGYQSFAHDKVDLIAAIPELSGILRAIGIGDLGRQLLQGNSVKRESLGVGCDANAFGDLAHQIGQPDILRLGDLSAQLAGDAGQVIGADAINSGFRRQRQRHDGHIVDTAPDDQRLRNADRNPVDVRADPVMHPQNSSIRRGADLEASRD